MKEFIKKIIPEKIEVMIRNSRNKLKEKIRKQKIGGFDVMDVYNGHFNVKYRGIPTLKCPFDYVIYQMIINEVSPDLIIEIGTSNGGSALYMADIMDKIGHGEIHTIDRESMASELTRKHPRIKLFTDGWERYDLSNAKNFRKIIVLDDASHNYDDVIGTLKKFSSIVSLGSYFIIEDGIVTRIKRDVAHNGGPLRAIHDFIKTNDNFKIDREWCDIFGKNATFNPDGYLKRIR